MFAYVFEYFRDILWDALEYFVLWNTLEYFGIYFAEEYI